MTGALIVYSAVFMRYSMAVQPKNYLLFACHFINEASQLTQGYRFLSYHNWGGKEKAMKAKAESGITEVKGKANEVADTARAMVEKAEKEVAGK